MVNRYLTLTPLEQALLILRTSFSPPSGTDTIHITDAINRIVAVPVYARYSVPEVNIAAMDGIAVRSRETIGANDQRPLSLKYFARVNTGNIVPKEFDAVIMIEDTWQHGSFFQIRKSAVPNQYIRPAGEDIKENQLVIPAGHLIRPFDIGAFATYGITHVDVKSVNVGIIPTGSELVSLGVRPKPGQVVESNTIMAKAFLESMGAHCKKYPIVYDNPDHITDSLKNAVRENDLVIISAGSSAGTRDFTAHAIKSLGELLFHGVSIRPGKPVILGRIQDKPVIGLPGYPHAAQTILREFAMRLLETWGFVQPLQNTLHVRLAQRLNSDLGFDDFIPVYIGKVGNICWGVPHSRRSSVQMNTVRANGYVHVPAMHEGYESSSKIEVVLTTSPAQIDQTLLMSGSLDLSLERLANLLSARGLFIQASEAGNMGALLALQKNSCHAAPMCLPSFSLLPDCRFLIQHIPQGGLFLVHIAAIEIGIASRTPLNPENLADVRWINTGKDSAYRMILDAKFSSQGINPASVKSYNQIVKGPDAVVTAICNKIADAGMCNAELAATANLHFMPVGVQRYELAIRPETLGDPKICALIAAIRSREYRRNLAEHSGYDLSQTGAIHQYSEDNTIRELSEDVLAKAYSG